MVAIDCEMVGCYPTKEWPCSSKGKGKANSEVSVAAQCVIVDHEYNIIYKNFISPGDMEVTRLGWRGLDPAKVRNGKPFKEARKEVLSLLKGKIVVGHDIHHDLASLQIVRDIPPENIRDTATCDILRNMAGVPLHYPKASLRALAKGVLKRDIQKTFPHNPVEDAKVTMELYRSVQDEWESQQ